MKRVCVFGALIILLLSACTRSSPDQVYYVMFEGPPQIFDTGVYFRGERIGEVLSVESGDPLAHRVTIAVPEASRQLVQTRSAFLVSAGRLNLTELAAYGEPLPLGSSILGFRGKGDLIGFRLKHLMQPLPAAAMQKAARLHDRTG